ncbi:hypothetical protein [Terricaulis sp.]|uniref:hypothetical protein n=1 Tax=Terricaulis sp. TaxID=2768686 RepID=UPI003785192B
MLAPMPQPAPIISQARVEAFAASALRLLAWLLGCVLRINPAGRGVRLGALLGELERAVESIIFLKATVLYGPPPPRRRHPRFAATGFRRIQTRRLRLFFRGARVRARKAGALRRVLALIDALACPERAVRYFLKRLRKGLHLSRVVPTAPPAQTLAQDAQLVAEVGVDSS